MSKQTDEVKNWRLSDAYVVPGFRVLQRVDSHEFDRRIFVLTLARRPKKRRDAAVVENGRIAFTTSAGGVCGDREVYLDLEMRRVKCKTCGVKNEKLDFLSENTKYTLRFAMQIGGLCRAMTVKDVAKRMYLDWHTVKDLEKIYMREQIHRAGHPEPKVIGVDEIAIRKGHTYRIVVSDLEKRRAIWFGGEGRTEKDMDLFYAFLGKENAGKIRLAVMDMWKAFRNSTQRNAPQTAVLFDKFHILRHLSDALDEVRRCEYKRLTGDDRAYIKGQRYVLLSRRENLSGNRRKNLERLLQANARLNVAYLLREQFEQLWDYASPEDARAFFDAWRDQLLDHDLKPYEKFAAMIEKHWDGIAAYSQPTHTIPLGFVEGFNNKIRTLQRRAYGLRDEEYLRLKILTTALPEL